MGKRKDMEGMGRNWKNWKKHENNEFLILPYPPSSSTFDNYLFSWH
jgi:hypothetical protein